MFLRKNMIASVLAGFVALAAISCCCTQAIAQSSVASEKDHSCCPKESKAKADPAAHPMCLQCQHQLSDISKPDGYLTALLEKSASFYALSAPVVKVAFSAVVATIPNGPPERISIPLYLQLRNLRL